MPPRMPEQYMSHSLGAVKNSLDYAKPTYRALLLLSATFFVILLIFSLPNATTSLSPIEIAAFIISAVLFSVVLAIMFLPVTARWTGIYKMSTRILDFLFSVLLFLLSFQFGSSKMTSASTPYLIIDIWLITPTFIMCLIAHNRTNEVVSQQNHIRDLQDQLQTLRMSEPQQIVEPDTVGHAPKESSRLRLLGMVINPFQRPRF